MLLKEINGKIYINTETQCIQTGEAQCSKDTNCTQLCIDLPARMLSHTVMFNSLQAHRLEPARLLCAWTFPNKNTKVGCHFLPQEDHPKPETDPHLLCLIPIKIPEDSLQIQTRLTQKLFERQNKQNSGVILKGVGKPSMKNFKTYIAMGNQDCVVLVAKTHRSTQQDRKPTNRPTQIHQMNLQQRCKVIQ